MVKKPYLVGQAPARSGDGRPFTGTSGRRLMSLLDVPDYSGLLEYFELHNLIPVMQPKRGLKGDEFNLPQAKEAARRFRLKVPPHSTIIACGSAVFRAFTTLALSETCPNFCGVELIGPYRHRVEVYHFPHPSGVNRFWNDLNNVIEARVWLQAASGGHFPAISQSLVIADR